MPTPRLRPRARAAALVLFGSVASAPFLPAADFYKSNNETNLELIAAWENFDATPVAAAPTNSTTSTDAWIWDNRVTAAADVGADGFHNVTVGAGKDLGVRTIRIIDPALPVVFNGNARTFTPTDTGGIDMAAAMQDFTLQDMFYRLAAGGITVSMNVASGRTLTFGSTAQVTVRNSASNALVNFNTDGTSAGKIVFNNAFTPSHVVVGGGRVEFNNPAGTNRISTDTAVNPASYTNINGGVLMVNNTSGSATGDSIVNVNDTGTLGGAGRITGNTHSVVNANAGSTLSPGNDGIGTLAIGKLNLAAGSTLVWEANSAAQADLIDVLSPDGLVVNGGTIKLYEPGTTNPFSGTGVFTLFAQSGAIGGAGLSTLAIDETTKVPGRTYLISQGDRVVHLVISDEPLDNSDWAVDASGDWSTASNWTGGIVPDGASSVARFTGSGATLTAPRTVTLDSTRTIHSVVLDSTLPVTLAGSASLTLDAGGAAAALSSSNANHTVSVPLSLTTGGALASVDGAGNTLTLSGVISGGAVGVVKTGDGTLVLAGDNAYTGPTAVASGTLQIGAGGTAGAVAGPISVSANATLRFNRSDSVSLTSAISGGGPVDFAGIGSTTLQSANTYSGTTTLSAGTLVVAHSLALQNSTLDYTSSGGALSVSDPVATLTLGGLSGDRALPLTNSIGAPLSLSVGSNNSTTTYSGSPIGTGTTFTKTGTGNLTLTGNHSYSGNTLVNGGVLSIGSGATFGTASANTASGGTARIVVSGGTLNASGASTISNATAGLLVGGGTANFTGGLANETGSSTGNITISVTGGALNASSINLSRGGLSIINEPASGQTANGLYINGGDVHVTGTLGIGAISGANSSVSARIDSGSLTVDGAFTVGIANTGRWSVFDANGGVVTVNDTTNGLLLGSPFAGQVIMHVRGSSVVNVPRIQFGQAALAGRSILSLSDGALYVGSGGLVLGSSNAAFVSEIRLGAGTLGASADWSSSIPVQLIGFPAVVTGADAANTPRTVTLSGPVTGVGQLRKTGAGTVLFTNPANIYQDAVTVESGTLGLAGAATFGITVQSGGVLAPQGVLNSSFGATIDGGLAIRYDGSATVPVPRLDAAFGVTLGGASSLVVSGTGSLPGPAYPIIKGPVSGTFATVSLPDGFSIDYAYDDDNDPGTATVVALVGGDTASPYDAWTASFSLSGNDALASADPDGDGFANLIEFAFSSSPVAANGAPWTVARAGNFLTLSFNHPADSGLTYEVEATNDLAGAWTTVHTFPAFTSATTATYTDTVDLSAAGVRRFLRLKISAAP
jgi:autotransporter-associated beta strand protein